MRHATTLYTIFRCVFQGTTLYPNSDITDITIFILLVEAAPCNGLVVSSTKRLYLVVYNRVSTTLGSMRGLKIS